MEPFLIHRSCHNSFETGRYERVTDEEHFANETQLAKLDELGLSVRDVVVHEIISKLDPETGEQSTAVHHWMLTEDWRNRRAIYITPDGEIVQANTPYPWCIGNSRRADCVACGSCRRNPSCGD